MPAALLVFKSPPLCGELLSHSAKNSVLPILAATLLPGRPASCIIPRYILDVTTRCRSIRHLGCSCRRSGSTLSIDPRGFAENAVPPALAGSMRASSLFLGALLARTGAAALTLPGGCPIGARPIDYHLQAFRALGASAEEEGGTVRCRADRLHGACLRLPGPSVGATENAMLAALGADGCTTIENAACEPEIADLGAFLCACGADLRGAGTPTIEIEGGKALHGATYTILPDRIETATYLCACAACGGALTLRRAAPASCAGVIEALGQCGCRIRCGYDTMSPSIGREPLTACRPVTGPALSRLSDRRNAGPARSRSSAQGRPPSPRPFLKTAFSMCRELRKLGAKAQPGQPGPSDCETPEPLARACTRGDTRGGGRAPLVLEGHANQGESTIFGVNTSNRDMIISKPRCKSSSCSPQNSGNSHKV